MTVEIRKIPTGVPGLDEILGGGLPEYSFNILGGGPGSGKTTIAHQVMFANATPEKPAVYFTILGEPAIKMLRYQQQFSFFDGRKVNESIFFINLSEKVLSASLDTVMDEIIREVEAINPGIVIVDSFRTLTRKLATSEVDDLTLQEFVQKLALQLTTWEATTFLVAEYDDTERRDNPIFTVADGLLWLFQQQESNSIVRKLQVVKMRGVETVPGMHTFRINDGGVQTFPRNLGLLGRDEAARDAPPLSSGIPELDVMLGGGIPAGDSLLIAGPTGCGKSLIATHFIEAGLRNGEAGIIAVFEERPDDYAKRADGFGLDLTGGVDAGKLEIIYLRPLDLSVDETVYELLDAVQRTGATRVVIDSLAGFEMALAPGFRTDFREALYRMIGALTSAGVTIVTTVEVTERFTQIEFSGYTVSFLSDDIIRLRYVEFDGEIGKVMFIVKMRGGHHSKEIRRYEIQSDGIAVSDEPLRGYTGLLTGIPTRPKP
ncbi:MAG: AAA family ATPase [Xanthomonadaceae bacterium]|nr:AAA family ATPase [Xanthomonadaceae bacterium]